MLDMLGDKGDRHLLQDITQMLELILSLSISKSKFLTCAKMIVLRILSSLVTSNIGYSFQYCHYLLDYMNMVPIVNQTR